MTGCSLRDFSPEVGACAGHRCPEEGLEFRETGRNLSGRDLFLAFAAEGLELDHAHGAGGALELVEDFLAVLEAVLGEGGVQVRQLVPPVRLEVVYDGEEELGPAGGHGVDLGGIKKSHATIIRPGRLRGKSKERLDQGGLFRGGQANAPGFGRGREIVVGIPRGNS